MRKSKNILFIISLFVTVTILLISFLSMGISSALALNGQELEGLTTIKQPSKSQQVLLPDTDEDGIPDQYDREPDKKYIYPVVLIHGYTDNSYHLFGAYNDVCPYTGTSKALKHYIQEENGDKATVDFSSLKQQEVTYYINDTSKYLYAYLINEANYPEDKVLVFNYANRGHLFENVYVLKEFISEYAKQNTPYTSECEEQYKKPFIDIVGHSMGGLVTRYYVENFGGDRYIRKLISVNTPHWGSNTAEILTKAIEKFGLNSNYHDYAAHLFKPTSEYYNGSETDQTVGTGIPYAFNYQKSRKTKYYAIMGINDPARSGNKGEQITALTGKDVHFDTFEDFVRVLKKKGVLDANADTNTSTLGGVISSAFFKKDYKPFFNVFYGNGTAQKSETYEEIESNYNDYFVGLASGAGLGNAQLTGEKDTKRIVDMEQIYIVKAFSDKGLLHIDIMQREKVFEMILKILCTE